MAAALEGNKVIITFVEQLDGDDESEAALFLDWQKMTQPLYLREGDERGTRGTLEDADIHLSANRGISPVSPKTHRYDTVYHYAIDPEVWYVYSSVRK